MNTKIWLWLAFLILAITPHEMRGDGLSRFEALSRFLSSGSLPNTKYSLLGPLFSAPLWYLGKIGSSPEHWCKSFNAILVIFGILRIRKVLNHGVSTAFAGQFALALAAASMFLPVGKTYDAEMFTALCTLLGIIELSFGRGELGWLFLVLGAVNIPATLLGLLFLCIYEFRNTKKIRSFFVFAIAIGFVLLERQLKFGDIFRSGYERDHGYITFMPYSGQPGFSFPMVFGLLSIVFSFGKGLLMFMPGLFLLGKTWRNLKSPDWVEAKKVLPFFHRLLLFSLGLVLVYSKWWSWYGGFGWGPRFFLFISALTTFCLVVCESRAKSRSEALILLVVFGFSSWVCMEGLVYGNYEMGICSDNDFQKEVLCWYTPEFSALFRPFIVPKILNLREKFSLLSIALLNLVLTRRLWPLLLFGA